jgi:hypothetical protein
MLFNEFNRRLESCHLDSETKALFAHMFEVQMELVKTVDVALNVLNAMADSVQNVTTLHAVTQGRIKELLREKHAEVRSVRDEDF